jgi:hypothetical protein
VNPADISVLMIWLQAGGGAAGSASDAGGWGKG